MDVAPIIGLVLGVFVVLGAVLLGGSPAMFIDPVSIVVVGIGCIAAVFTAFPLKNILGLLPVLLKTFDDKFPNVNELIAQLGGFADARGEPVDVARFLLELFQDAIDKLGAFPLGQKLDDCQRELQAEFATQGLSSLDHGVEVMRPVSGRCCLRSDHGDLIVAIAVGLHGDRIEALVGHVE